MTNEELLQQAKDQVFDGITIEEWTSMAKGIRPGEALSKKGPYEGCWGNGEMTGYARCIIHNVLPLLEKLEAALLAIQSAREEGKKEWFEKGYECGVWRGAHESSDEAFEKLTAPGR